MRPRPDPTFDSVDLGALRRRRSEKWAKHPPDVLPSFLAELDFALAPPIAAVLTEAVENGDLGYAHAGTELGEAFAGFARRRWEWDLEPGAVLAVPDVMVGVAELLRLLTSPGAGVVVNTPVYPPFFSVIAEVGRRVVEVPLLGPDRPERLPLDGIRDAFAKGAEAMLLCNPHNPTGYVAGRAELLALGEIVESHGGLVLADEIHAPLVLDGARHVPILTLPGGASEAAISLTSATKAWNLAGLKCGLAIARSQRLRAALAALPVDLHDRVGHLGILASVAAFTRAEPWLDELRSYLAETRRWFPGLLAERLPGIGYHPGQATYLAWLDCRALGLGDDPAAHFLARGRVALTSGLAFGALGAGFARLNLGTSRALIEEAVDRMASAKA
ncbi:MAG: MalY/PatB family protein [Gaiellaceae bacterium]